MKKLRLRHAKSQNVTAQGRMGPAQGRMGWASRDNISDDNPVLRIHRE